MPAAWVAAAGAIVGAVGAISSADAASQSSNYQAQVAKNNAEIENQNANFAAGAGIVQGFNQSLANRGAAGRLKANISAAGLDVNSGSAVAAEESQRAVGLENVQTIASNTQRQVYGYRNQAIGDVAQSELDTQAAQNDIIGGDIGAAGSLIGGGSKFIPTGSGSGSGTGTSGSDSGSGPG